MGVYTLMLIELEKIVEAEVEAEGEVEEVFDENRG